MEKINCHNLTDKVAIITGAGDGIGKASALLLAKHGAKIICSDLNLEKAEETMQEIKQLGGDAIAVKCNVTIEQEMIDSVNAGVEKFGKIDILLNNAGGGGGGREFIETMDYEYINRIYKLNVLSVFTMVKLCVPHMKKAGGGSIINISSLASKMTSKNMSVYGSSKAAINKLTEYLATDLGQFNIRINAIAPGAIKTHALATILTPEIEAKMLNNTPLGRLGQTEDIANGVLFFASGSSAWVSGQILVISGGGTQELD